MSAVQFDQLIVNAATSRDIMSTQWLRHFGHKFWFGSKLLPELIIILLNKLHCVLNLVVRTFTQTTTQHYAMNWSICILHGSAVT